MTQEKNGIPFIQISKMDNKMETISDKIKKYKELKDNPMADQRTIDAIKKSLGWVNLNSLTEEEKKILFS